MTYDLTGWIKKRSFLTPVEMQFSTGGWDDPFTSTSVCFSVFRFDNVLASGMVLVAIMFCGVSEYPGYIIE